MSERTSWLFFAGTEHLFPPKNRHHWVESMKRIGPPDCRLNLLNRSKRKVFNLTAMELGYSQSRFSLNVPGHVGPRKAVFDSMKCGALPLFASDYTDCRHVKDAVYAPDPSHGETHARRTATDRARPEAGQKIS